MEFENKAPKWDAAGTEPSADLQANGFTAGYKPPAAYFNYLFNRYTAALNELQGVINAIENGDTAVFTENNPPTAEEVGARSDTWMPTAEDIGALPLEGGTLAGALTVMENFNVNRTYDGVEYKTFVRPINYSIGADGNYTTGLIHYNNGVNNAQLMFSKDGVMLRDNVAGKAYKLYGQHFMPTAADVGALPISGGTVTKGASTVMQLKNSSANRTYLGFIGGDTLGYLGFESQDVPAFVMKSGVVKNLYHTGNITNGTSALTAKSSTLATGAIYLQYE